MLQSQELKNRCDYFSKHKKGVLWTPFFFDSRSSTGQRAAWLKLWPTCNSNFNKSPLVG